MHRLSKCAKLAAVTAALQCVLAPSFAGDEGAAVSKDVDIANAVSVARRELWQAVNSGKCTSASVAITLDGKTVYTEGFGMADREKGIPVDSKTVFNIGSVSKVYVATAIMLLAEDGKLSLDKPVVDYLPEFKMADPRYKDITVRMLLNHTSGLPGTEYSSSMGFKLNLKQGQETLEFLSGAVLKHEPGAMGIYCNDGFTLAELIVDKVSGMPYLDFLRQRIFMPLKLERTGASVGVLPGGFTAAKHYDLESGLPWPLEAVSVLGAGGLSTTPEELCQFVEAASGARHLLSPSSVKEMRRSQPGSAPLKLRRPGPDFGLGWDSVSIPTYKDRGIQILGKSGGSSSYISMTYVLPDLHVAVSLLTAGLGCDATSLALDIVDAALSPKKSVPVRLTPAQGAPIPSQDAAFAGYYSDAQNLLKVEFDSKTGMLFLKNCEPDAPAIAHSFTFKDGLYSDGHGTSAYFANVDGSDYFVSSSDRGGIDMPMLKKVEPLKEPKTLRIDMDGKQWLRRNVAPYEAASLISTHMAKSAVLKDLPGYVRFGGLCRVDSPDAAGMPYVLRDLMPLKLVDKPGSTWILRNEMLYSPIEAAKPLSAKDVSTDQLQIGPEGYNEWLLTKSSLQVDIAIPEGGRLSVFSPNREFLFDSALKSARSLVLSEGCLLELAGQHGAVFKFSVKPAE